MKIRGGTCVVNNLPYFYDLSTADTMIQTRFTVKLQ